MYINFGSINSRQAADGSCTAPLTVDSCGTCRLKKHASLPTITRYDENAYQLFYIAAGKAHFWFDDAEHVVTAGHMVLYRPQEERRYIYYLEDHPEVFWVYFSGSEAAAVLQAHEIPLDGHVFYSGISFKQYVGLSPARYIQSLRIVNAQRLLERTKYSIGEVSEIVGYDNPLYFSRVFKKETGLSPAQYRKAERAGEQPSDPQEEDACTPNIDKNRNS